MDYPASQPVSGGNAIEKLTCGIVFAQPLSATALVEMRSALDQLKDDLPGHSEERQVTAGLVPGVPIDIAQLLGRGAERYARFFTGPDGVVKWRVTVSQELLSIECFEFTGKQIFFEKIQKYVNSIIFALIEKDINPDLREIGFHVVDKFNYGVDFLKENYSATEIFDDKSIYLTKNVFSGGLFWHVFQGWFESCKDPEHKLLQQLNIQNTETNPITKEISTIIEHQMMHQVRNNSVKADELLGDGEFGAVCVFGGFYERNKRIIKELLCAEKLKQIGFEA